MDQLATSYSLQVTKIMIYTPANPETLPKKVLATLSGAEETEGNMAESFYL